MMKVGVCRDSMFYVKDSCAGMMIWIDRKALQKFMKGRVIMKIRQQNQIKLFLINEFGKDKGSALFLKNKK